MRVPIWAAVASFAFAADAGPEEPKILRPGENSVQLTSRPRPQLRRRQEASTNSLALANAFNGTDLQWYGKVAVGTPAQYIQMCFDTGSPDIIFPSVACTAARGCVKGAKFDESKSSTFKTRNRPWIEQFGTGVGVTPSDHPNASGLVGTDTITLAGITVPEQAVGLITKLSPDFFHETEIEGVFGLSPSGRGVLGGSTFFANIVRQKKIGQKLFAMFMTPKNVGNAELTLGGVNPEKFIPPFTWVPINLRSGSWNMTFQSVSAAGQKIATPTKWAIADSGTSNMYAPKKDALAIYAALSPDIKLIDERGAYGLPCSQVPALEKKNITFIFDGRPFVIPGQALTVGEYPSMPGTCQTLINTERGIPFWIIGGSLMKYYYTVWDVGNSRLGWAKTAHSP